MQRGLAAELGPAVGPGLLVISQGQYSGDLSWTHGQVGPVPGVLLGYTRILQAILYLLVRGVWVGSLTSRGSM